MSHQDSPSVFGLLRPVNKNKDGHVNQTINGYTKFYDQNKKESDEQVDNRHSNKEELVTSYYDIATDFFEYGWGESFHFSQLRPGESREHAFAKHEYRLALKLQIQPTDKVLDAGCGIGGPARHIAAFANGAHITGLNISDYQLARARQLTEKAGLSNRCQFVKGNFCNAPFASETFDKAYAIEATCHAAPDLKGVYGEIYRLLKPGGYFACYEWIMTDNYDPQNAYHKKIKEDILVGDGLPDLVLEKDVHKALHDVGFEIIEADDLALTSPIPWESVLTPRWTVSDFKITPLGRWVTHVMLMAMETARLAPKGSTKCHKTLCKGADGLVLGGKEAIFTPMYFFVVRKPLK